MSQTSTPRLMLHGLDRAVILATTAFLWLAPLVVAAWLAYYKPFAEIDVFLAVFVAALPLMLTLGR